MSVDLTSQDTSARMRGIQYKTRSYSWNGKDAMRKIDSVAWASAGIRRAQFVPTLTSPDAGDLTGTYRYFVVPVHTTHLNLLGRCVAGLPSFISEEITVSSKKITVGGIPSTHPSAHVDKWQIYRNKNGVYDSDVSDDLQDFFYVGEVAIGTTTFVDNMKDEEMDDLDVLRWNQNQPPAFEHGAMYGERLFGLGFTPYTTGTVTKTTLTISSISRTSNIVTVVTTTNHGYAAENYVAVECTNPLLNGPVQIRTQNGTDTFTYHRPGPDIGAGATGSVETLTFSGSTIRTGFGGCWFRKEDDATLYRIAPARNSSSVLALDRLFSGTLSGSSFRIFRYPWEVYFSEYGDVEAWGPDGEGTRWRRELPGQDHAKGIINHMGQLLVFSATKIYSITGKGVNPEDIRIAPDPLYAIGAVSGDAICKADDDVYFMSLRGPARLRGGQLELIGQRLLTDWLDGLTAAEQALCCCGSNGDYVWFSFPVSGATENSRTWRYDIGNDTWWEQKYMHPLFYFNDDGDNGVQGQCYYVQGKCIMQCWTGTTDVISTTYSGTSTAVSTTTLTDSGASFSTSGAGLAQAYIHIFRTTAGVQSHVGSRRIISNTATQVTWDSSGAGGGTLSLTVGDTYEIGNIWWRWKTKDIETPAHQGRVMQLHVSFGTVQGSAVKIKKTDYMEGVASSSYHEVTAQQTLSKHFDVNTRTRSYAALLESRTGATLRHVTAKVATKAGVK